LHPLDGGVPIGLDIR